MPEWELKKTLQNIEIIIDVEKMERIGYSLRFELSDKEMRKKVDKLISEIKRHVDLDGSYVRVGEETYLYECSECGWSFDSPDNCLRSEEDSSLYESETSGHPLENDDEIYLYWWEGMPSCCTDSQYIWGRENPYTRDDRLYQWWLDYSEKHKK